MTYDTLTVTPENIFDPFTTNITPSTWTDEPLVPLHPEFNVHFQLQVDKNEHQGMRNFIKGYIEPKHLDEHQATLTRKLNLINTSTPDKEPIHSYFNELSDLLDIHEAAGLLEKLKPVQADRSLQLKLIAKYPYLKKELHVSCHRTGAELQRIKELENLYQKCGFSPLKDSLHDVNMTPCNITREHGYGDFAIVTRGKNSKLIYLIETKNTIKAMGNEFFSEIHSQEQRSLGQDYKYAFLTVWPESDLLAEKYLAYNGINLLDFNKQFRLWKDRFYCRKVRMSDEVFEAPMHDQGDPIGLFRSRTVHMANAIRKICNNVCRDLIH